MKKNVWRIVFWGLIAILFLSLGVFGCVNDNMYLKANKEKLQKIIEIFNKHEKLIEYKKIGTEINAKLKGKKIIILFGGATEKKYEYKLNRNVISNTFDENDVIGMNIFLIMADSVNISNGNTSKNIFELYKTNELIKYNITDGININTTNLKTKVKIDITKTIISQNSENEYFDIEDFNNEDINQDLVKHKNGLTFIREKENIFSIEDKNNNIEALQTSVNNIINYFYGTKYNEELFNIDYINEINFENDNMKVEFRPTKNKIEADNFETDNFIRITIKMN